MIRAVVGALVLALQAAAPVDTQSPASAPAAATKPAKVAKPPADPNRIVCREETVTGSHLSRRVCLRQSDWDAAQANGETYIQGVQDESRTNISRDGSQGRGGGF
jgi:hypothetical protein